MTRLSLLAALLALSATPWLAPRADDERSLLEELDWLSGRWTMEADGLLIEETWSPASHDAMVGCLRWARKGEVWLYELMSIELEDETLVMRVRHFGRKLEPWKSEADGPLTLPLSTFDEGAVMFEDPAAGNPRRIEYEREGDQLTIRLENAQGEVTNRFVMKRS